MKHKMRNLRSLLRGNNDSSSILLFTKLYVYKKRWENNIQHKRGYKIERERDRKDIHKSQLHPPPNTAQTAVIGSYLVVKLSLSSPFNSLSSLCLYFHSHQTIYTFFGLPNLIIIKSFLFVFRDSNHQYLYHII